VIGSRKTATDRMTATRRVPSASLACRPIITRLIVAARASLGRGECHRCGRGSPASVPRRRKWVLGTPGVPTSGRASPNLPMRARDLRDGTLGVPTGDREDLNRHPASRRPLE
jgi:hypothetical protein